MRQRKINNEVRYPRRKRRKKKSSLNFYKMFVIAILIFGGIVIFHKMYQLYEIHQDMQMTLQQESTLKEEQQQLQSDKDRLENPEEVGKEARQRFGLVKSGEIPYKR